MKNGSRRAYGYETDSDVMICNENVMLVMTLWQLHWWHCNRNDVDNHADIDYENDFDIRTFLCKLLLKRDQECKTKSE